MRMRRKFLSPRKCVFYGGCVVVVLALTLFSFSFSLFDEFLRQRRRTNTRHEVYNFLLAHTHNTNTTTTNTPTPTPTNDNHTIRSSIRNRHTFSSSLDNNDNDDKYKDYLINPRHLCRMQNSNSNKRSNLLLFVTFVVISPHSFAKRAEIRATWANQTLFGGHMRVLFALGSSASSSSSSSSSPQVNRGVASEAHTYGDILLIDFVDSYFNMTYKIMRTLKWVKWNCPHAAYIMRINDDVVVNTYALIRLFGGGGLQSQLHLKKRTETSKKEEEEHGKSSLIYGLVVKEARVDRRSQSKFYIKHKEYPFDTYVDYPSGK